MVTGACSAEGRRQHGLTTRRRYSEQSRGIGGASASAAHPGCNGRDDEDKTLLDTSCSGSFTRNKEEFKWDLLNRIQENAEDWENDKGRESGYADKPPFKPLPPKEGNEEKEKKKKKNEEEEEEEEEEE
ncbi:hypothetical protein QYE76_043744 [Lolium multiflorum]|uniref:Uncharacterized protein n=1 Tax=Lolium multiflorum TaxID=4521 RepID=A0AAD8THY4_LOLMU|nr:hypothetical protein QYE76_043744 [Lolium multiflorum]